MEFAIFEFADRTCEVGETSWVVGEEKQHFTNELWTPSTEVVVKWPKEFGKISRKLGKSSIDIKEISSILYTATIVKFDDDYDTIKKHLDNYLKTGDAKTPNRGRGQRISKRNLRYESGNDHDEEDHLSPLKQGPSKKPKYMKSTDTMISMVKEKYNLDDLETENKHSDDEDVSDEEELSRLKSENKMLKRRNKCLEGDVKDLKMEIRDMRQIVANVKELTNVNQALTELTKTVVSLKTMKGGTPSSSPSLSRTSSSSPSPQPSPLTMVDDFDEESSGADLDSNMVAIHPGITILKAQKKMLDACSGDAKKFTHSIMEMMWSREVLASHSMTGRSSNAHKDKEPKPCLDAMKISALCALVVRKFKLDEQKVKNLIKTKLHNVQKCLKLKKTGE